MTQAMTLDQDNFEKKEEERLRPKVGRIPLTLRQLNEQEEQHANQNETWSQATRNKGDTYFMLLLVTLFIVVNVTLVVLLNHRPKTADASAVATTTPQTSKPAMAIINLPSPKTENLTSVKTEGSAANATPAPSPSNIAQGKPAVPLTSLPVPPSVSVAAPVANAYVTPVTSSTVKSTAAPFQHVNISEQATDNKADNKTGTEALTIVHTQATQPLSEMAPAAGQPSTAKPTPEKVALPAAVSPEAARRDLLSVINKD